MGETEEAAPTLHRLVEGAAFNVAPFEEPHAPLTTGSAAAQLAVAPPSEPTQDHTQGLEPVTAVAVPALQRLRVGAIGVAAPLAAPQAPATGMK